MHCAPAPARPDGTGCELLLTTRLDPADHLGMLSSARSHKSRELVVEVAAIGWIIGIGVADVLTGRHILLPALLAIGPSIAALALRLRVTIAIAALAVLTATVLGIPDKNLVSTQHLADVVTVVMVGCLSVATALFRVRSEEALAAAEAAAARDPLTGLLNRRAVFNLGEAIAQLRHRPTLWIVMLDVDHFKPINDLHGHLVGDEILRQVGTRAASVLRRGDLLGRYGGDEFILVLVGGDEADATTVGERLLKSIISEPVQTHFGDVEVTVSGGLAIVAAGELDLWGAIGRADAALFRAKTSGRNRITLAMLEDRVGATVALEALDRSMDTAAR
jgi:diguanylate cyclase (GGDEF)-like protein